MGNYIGYTNPATKERHSTRIGTNGSGTAVMKLFAVAYAASGLPYEKRARDAVRKIRGIEYPPEMWMISTRQHVKDLLAINDQECFWADFDTKKAGTGFFMAPLECDIYAGILRPLLMLEMCDGNLILPPPCVPATARAWTEMLPLLQESPARERLTEMAALAQAAGELHVTLELS